MTRLPGAADPGTGDPHASHDRLLIAAYEAGDLTGDDLERAVALVASCPACASLHRDLRSVSAALAATPAPARPRDFRLDERQAASLRRPTVWRRLLAPLAGRRSVAGPLAASLAALGMAGLLLGGGLEFGVGGAATSVLAPLAASSGAPAPALEAGVPTSAPARASGETGPAADGGLATGAQPAVPSAAPAPAVAVAPSAAPSGAAVTSGGVGAPAGGAGFAAAGTAAPSGAPGVGAGPGAVPSLASGAQTVAGAAPAIGAPKVSDATAPAPQRGPSPLVLGSLAALAAGVILGVLRLAARRLR